MGCGSSSNVVPSQEPDGQKANGNQNGHGVNGQSHGGNGQSHDVHDDGLPTVVLPDTPVKAKPPIAFEIPLEEFEGGKANSPPPHLQRLLVPPQPDLSLPDIEEKLAVAEMRRQSLLQQRAASAQKKTQKIMKQLNDMERPPTQQEQEGKHGTNTLTIPQETVGEHKNIT